MHTKKITIIACVLSLCATATVAQEVELYTNDGKLTLRGQLIEFVDNQYTIDTSLGILTFDSSTILCRGDACPAVSPPIPEINIVSVGRQVSGIMPKLLPSYAQSLDAQISETDDGIYALTNIKNEEIALISLSDISSLNTQPGLLQNQIAIVLTSKPLLPEQASELNLGQKTDQASNNAQVIGLNAITIITAKGNPINSISISDVAKVFSGEYNNWSELGGPDAPITLYGPQSDSELARSFESQIISPQDDEVSRLTQDIVIVENIEEQVSSDPNGIGYTYFSNSQTAKSLDILGVCGMSTPANTFTIKAEEYPLTQRLYAYRLASKDVELVNMLLSFIQTNAGQDIVSSLSLVNLRDTSYSINNQGNRFVNAIATSATDAESELLREMVTPIMRSKRLSTTFRFETGSNQMDHRAQADIIRLAEKLQSPGNGDSAVHLLGFTDSVGDFDLNQEVSLRRANQVRDALIEIDTALAERVSILPAGFGEITPIACNEIAQGRSINRRVEVWMDKGETPSTQ